MLFNLIWPTASKKPAFQSVFQSEVKKKNKKLGSLCWGLEYDHWCQQSTHVWRTFVHFCMSQVLEQNWQSQQKHVVLTYLFRSCSVLVTTWLLDGSITVSEALPDRSVRLSLRAVGLVRCDRHASLMSAGPEWRGEGGGRVGFISACVFVCVCDCVCV